MSNTNIKSRHKLAFNVLIIAALAGIVGLVYYKRDIIDDTWQVLLSANVVLVLALPVLQITNYYFIGKYYQKAFGMFDAKISTVRSWQVVAAMNFVNQVLPSGGLSGITYLAYGFRKKVNTGQTGLVQLGRYIFAFLAYAVLAPFALLLLAINGYGDDFRDVVSRGLGNSSAVAVMLVFLGLICLVAAAILRPGFLVRIFKPKSNGIIKKTFGDLRAAVDIAKSRGSKVVSTGLFMLFSTFIEIAIVYASLMAVGADISIGAVFVAFVAANTVGVVSIIPGDVGVHEAAMVVILAAFGVPEPIAISATLLYRVFNKMLFLPVGFFFYQRILKPALGDDA